ncbi:hypothetical protein V7S43_018627, partial [Phytophthora oleae]
MRPSSSQQLSVGDYVAVKPKPSDSGGVKKLGRVQRLRSSGTVDVFYADGRVEERVGRDRLLPPRSPDSKTPRSSKNAAPKTSTRPNRSPAAKRESTRPRTSRQVQDDEYEEKAPAPSAEGQRMFVAPATASTATQRARTADSRNTATSKKRQPADASAHTARGSQKQPVTSSRRQRDLSDSVAQTQKQVTEVMETIAAADADAVAVKNSLSLLLRVIRSAPQITAECILEQNGEVLLLDTIQAHSSHAVLLCYGCVLMRKLCHLSLESAELFLQHAIIPTVAQALLSFPEDAILQASACGCLAVLAQTSDVSKNEMLAMDDPSVLGLVLASLESHREYSNLTRQVQIYACEVLTELSDYGGPSTVASVIAHDPRRKTESPIELAVSLTRQGVDREDKKVTCSFCSLLLCLASNSSAVAESLRELGAIADISVVMAKYPVDEGIIRFSAAALREIAETSLSHSPSKTVHEKARVILDEDLSPQPSRSSTPALPTRRERSPGPGASSSRSRDTSPRATGRRSDTGRKSTGRRRPKSPTTRPTTSSGVPVSGGSFGQLSHALGDAPSASFFTSPVKLLDDVRTATSRASRLPPPRSRDEHIQRAGDIKRRKNGNGQRDRLLMQTYGNSPLGSKAQRSDAFGLTDREFSRESSSSRFSPLKNNYLGTEDVTFVIPPPLSSSQSQELPITSRGTKTPTRPHSARLTPLVNERVKISSANPTSSAGEDAWSIETSMSTGSLRPQTAIVVTKLSDSTSGWDRPSDRGHRRKDREDSRELDRDRGRQSRSSSLDEEDDAASKERYDEASREPPARSNASDMTDMDQSMAELREFAQQLLKEEARISSLLAQTGSKSPGLNRMSFSDKLHKMIEIAESSMYERSLAMASHTGGDSTTRTPPTAATEALTTGPSNELAKQATRKTQPVADSKTTASDAQSAPKMLSSGYKKSRASAVGQKKQQKVSAKPGAVSPRGDRKVLSKLDLNVRTPSIPFLEPLQLEPEQAPAKQDTALFLQLESSVGALSGAEDSPQKKEKDKDHLYEESIQEEIPVVVEVPRQVEEKEDEPVPEHIDANHEDSDYHDLDAVPAVPTLHDLVEEVPIVEEIGVSSPWKDEKETKEITADGTQLVLDAQDEAYEEGEHMFEPDDSFVEVAVALDRDHIEKPDAAIDQASSSDSEEKKMEFEPVVRDSKSEERVVVEETGSRLSDGSSHEDIRDRKSEEDEIDSEQKATEAEGDDFEFIELPEPSQEDPLVSLDWTVARDACHEITSQGIVAALAGINAMGGVYVLVPPSELTPSLGNNETAVSTQLTTEADSEVTGHAPPVAASESVVLNALQNVVDSLTPSTVLAQDILSATIGQLTGDSFQSPDEDMANEVGRIVASRIAESLSNTVEQLRALPPDGAEGAAFAQRLNELVAVAVEAVAQRIRAEGDAVTPPATEQLPPVTIPPLDLLPQSADNNVNAEQWSDRSDTTRTDEGHVSVQMAKAIQDSVNGIIALSLVSMVQQFELSTQQDQGPEVGEEVAPTKQVGDQKDTSGDDDVLSAKKASVAVGNYVNGMIALSVQSSAERAFENRNHADALSELTVMSVNLQDLPRFQDVVLESERAKTDTKQSRRSDTEPVESGRTENNAEEELPVQTIIAISRTIDGIIALSLEKTVKQLCSVHPESVNDDDNEDSDNPPQFDGEDAAMAAPNNAEPVVSDDASAAIRRNISAIVAVSLEAVLQRLQEADEKLVGHRSSADEGQTSALPTERCEAGLPALDVYDQENGMDSSTVIKDTHGQDVWDRDNNDTPELQELPVAMAVSIQRSVNAILMQALENVITDLSRESDVQGEEEPTARPSASDAYYDQHHVDSVPYDHATAMTAIETFDQLHLPEDDDNQVSNRDSEGVSIQMVIAVRWTVSGMIALAVENVVTGIVSHTSLEDTVETSAEELGIVGEQKEDEEVEGSSDDGIAQEISSGMATAIRQTVDGIIERTAENVLAQLSSHTVKELVSQMVESTALSMEGPAEDPVAVAPDEEEPATLPIQMSLAIRQAVNGLIGVSLQAALADVTGKTPAQLSPEAGFDDESVVGNDMVEPAPLSLVSIPPLNLPFAQTHGQTSSRQLDPSDQDDGEDSEGVSVMAAIAVSRTVTAVIAAGVEKILDTMISVGTSLAAGNDVTAGSLLLGELGDDSAPAKASEDDEGADKLEQIKNEPANYHDIGDVLVKDEGDYEESLTPTMSVAVALSVKAMLMQAVDNVSQRVDLPREYKNDTQFVKKEVLEATLLEEITDQPG